MTAAPASILVVEDDAITRMLLTRDLEREGNRVETAEDGVPELDGLDASRRISERWPREDRPRIMATTANAMPEDRETCLAAGMDDDIAKPICPNELAEALSRAKPLREKGGVRPDAASVCFAFGVEDVAELCQGLGPRARSGTLDGAAELIDRIDREYAALEDTLAAPRSTPAS